jgi:hypothetical protein
MAALAQHVLAWRIFVVPGAGNEFNCVSEDKQVLTKHLE